MAAGMHARVHQSTRAPTVARLEPLMVVMVEDERHEMQIDQIDAVQDG